jgi:hypothetical protein
MRYILHRNVLLGVLENMLRFQKECMTGRSNMLHFPSQDGIYGRGLEYVMLSTRMYGWRASICYVF